MNPLKSRLGEKNCSIYKAELISKIYYNMLKKKSEKVFHTNGECQRSPGWRQACTDGEKRIHHVFLSIFSVFTWKRKDQGWRENVDAQIGAGSHALWGFAMFSWWINGNNEQRKTSPRQWRWESKRAKAEVTSFGPIQPLSPGHSDWLSKEQEL